MVQYRKIYGSLKEADEESERERRERRSSAIGLGDLYTGGADDMMLSSVIVMERSAVLFVF